MNKSFGEILIVWNDETLYYQNVIETSSRSTIYRVKTNDNKVYAVKCILRKTIKIEEYAMNEIGMYYKLKHENILKFYGHVEDENYYYLILEYCPKGSLIEYISSNDLCVNDIHDICRQIVEVIYYLHYVKNIIHCDIKLDNILIDNNGNVKLCDFEFAQNYDKNQCIIRHGTLNYIAPEIIRHESYSYGVDIWAFGVLYYAMLTGRFPFTTPTTTSSDIMKNILNNDYYIPIDFTSKTAYFIRKILEGDPNKRAKLEDLLEYFGIEKIEME